MRRPSFHGLALLLPILVACSTGGEVDTKASDSTTSEIDDSNGAPDTMITTFTIDSNITADATTTTDSTTTDSTTTDSTTIGETTTGETDSAMSGEQQYLMICAPCHGVSGEGTELGYELRHPVRDYATWVVRNGRPGAEFLEAMPAYDTSVVSDATLEEIWDYLDSFPQPSSGGGLYLDYCRNCHGEDANGGVTGRDISSKGDDRILETVRHGEHLGAFELRKHYMPAFAGSTLNDVEVQLIADHIDSL